MKNARVKFDSVVCIHIIRHARQFAIKSNNKIFSIIFFFICTFIRCFCEMHANDMWLDIIGTVKIICGNVRLRPKSLSCFAWLMELVFINFIKCWLRTENRRSIINYNFRAENVLVNNGVDLGTYFLRMGSEKKYWLWVRKRLNATFNHYYNY